MEWGLTQQWTTVQVIRVQTLNQNSSQISPSLPPQAMLRFDDWTDLCTKKVFTYIGQRCLGGRRRGYTQIASPKTAVLVWHYYFVIFWTVFTSVPTTFDFHCSYKQCPPPPLPIVLFLVTLCCSQNLKTVTQRFQVAIHFHTSTFIIPWY